MLEDWPDVSDRRSPKETGRPLYSVGQPAEAGVRDFRWNGSHLHPLK